MTFDRYPLPLLTFARINELVLRILGKGEEYILATCGNDSLVKLWLVHVINELTAKISLNLSLVGHGGDVTCVRFPPNSSSIVASTATDKTARIWNTVNRNF